MKLNEPGRTVSCMNAAADVMVEVEVGLGRYVPEHCREALRRYIASGRPLGDFLRAVVSNNFSNAVARADEANLSRLRDYMLFLNNHAPGKCWGSEIAYGAWRKRGGLAGMCKPKAALMRNYNDQERDQEQP